MQQPVRLPPAAESDVRREYRQITDEIVGRTRLSGHGYQLALMGAALLMGIGVLSWGWQLYFGMEVSGLQHPLMWAVYITSFVWWIGIAHAGTLISAFLFLFRVSFRPLFSRIAEAMAVIAIMAASAYPVIHLGRAWRGYWLFPYPNDRGLWPNFRSPLVLDVFAVLTDILVAGLFFWLGMLPDLAVLRDRSKGWARTVYGLLSLGWEGTGRQWKPYLLAYSLVAALAASLVISGHTVVAWDFALSIAPGWHSTIFPPYFLVGALFSGLAMLLALTIPARKFRHLEAYLRPEHFDRLARLILVTSLLLTFSRGIEALTIWLRPDEIERINLLNKAFGEFALPFWVAAFCNYILPLSLFWREVRESMPALFAISVAITVGMWLERFIVVTGSLARGYLPYSWAASAYLPSPVECGVFLGSLGWFIFCLLLLARYLPVFPLSELRRGRLRRTREAYVLRTAAERRP